MTNLALSKHLLWKDYRQLRPALVGCWAILVGILVLFCCRQLMVMRSDNLFPEAIMLVLASPTLTAMAAAGILIGHERQTRTWNWSSSLPVSWSSSLLSKLLVWALSSAVMVGTLLGIFYLLLQVCRLSGFEGESIPGWITPEIVVSTVIVVPLVVYVCFSLAALVWNDTLTAFVVAAVVVGFSYFVTSDLLPRFIGNIDLNRPLTGLDAAMGMAWAVLLLVVGVGAVMARIFQWRWTSGQLASIGWRAPQAAPVSAARRRAMWQSLIWSGPAPSEFRMLLAHGVGMARANRAFVFMLLCFVSGMLATNGPNDAVPFLIWLVAVTMGVTAFAGDQTQSAYKFFADRGVSWDKLLLAHVLPPLVLTLLPLMIPVIVSLAGGFPRDWEQYRVLSLVAVTPAMFLIGVFVSLCSRVSMLSVCMGVAAMVMAILAMILQFEFWRMVLIYQLPVTYLVLLVLAQAAILIAGTIRLLKNWLVSDRVNGAVHYVRTLCLALIPTHLLAIILCFLAVPNVPWQGLDSSEVRIESPMPKVDVPGIGMVTMRNRLYTYDESRIDDAVHMAYGQMASLMLSEGSIPSSDGLNAPAGDAVAEPPAAEPKDPLAPTVGVDGELKPGGNFYVALKKMEEQLDAMQAGSGAASVAKDFEVLNNEIENTAWIAAYATQQMRDLEVARRAWKVNRQLLSLVDYNVYHALLIQNSRTVSVLLRKHLTSEDWEFLRQGGGLEELQPEPVSREKWIHLVKMSFTLSRDARRQNPLGLLLFPIRWHEERLAAFILQYEIRTISGQPITPLEAGNPRIAQLNYYLTSLPQMIHAEERLPR